MQCKFCGQEFKEERKTAKFCTKKCNTYYNRGIKVNKKDLENIVSTTDVMEKIVEIRVSTTKIQPMPKTLKINKVKKNTGLFGFCPKHNVFYHSCGCTPKTICVKEEDVV